ncbi:MAG: DNA-formamidopyrimidine glycosylase [Anaerolineales bacterium]|nr:DNA-formamidopyrimidine glycosylase [Anaerolineales bacterium]
MPELPEVETIARALREGNRGRGPSVLGRTIARVTVRWPRHIARSTPAEVQQRLPGQVVQGISRRGKYLVFQLSQDVLLIHLKMSGDLTVVPADAPPDRHAHTIFHFTDGWELRFSDTRKFGKVFVVPQAEAVTATLGPEPLDEAFTAQVLGERLAARKRALKPLLLDQSFLAGVGNIYADESLHRAGLHPLRRSHTLTPAEVRALWQAIRRSLRAGLKHSGASIDWQYRGGGFQKHFRVYDRAGEPCRVCGALIRRIVVGQRSTYFCPYCQPLRRRSGERHEQLSG